MRVPIFTLICTLISTSAFAADESIPPIIKAGFEAYAAKGAEAAWTTWNLADSQKSIGGKEQLTAEDKARFVATLTDAAKDYGKPLGFELVRSYDISLSYKTLFFVWRFEKKPLFCMFVCYRDQHTWKILNFFLTSDPREYLSESVSGMPTPTK
jgi:hypothetical protein